jgi:glycosyltransferase involved in cell wall biosynthesis
MVREGDAQQAGDLVVGTVTRVSPGKGVEVLVEAVGIMTRRGLPVRCVVAGGGPLVKTVLEQVRERGLVAVIDVVGNLSQPEVWDLLRRLNVFVLASEDEGMPMAVLEAMAAGLPVVATPVGGIPELVKHGVSGLLVPVGDAEALAEALSALGQDAGKRHRMGAAGRAAYEQRYTEAAVWPKWEALYDSLLRRQGMLTPAPRESSRVLLS